MWIAAICSARLWHIRTHGLVGNVGRRVHFVDVAADALHDEEGPAQHVAGVFEPQRRWHPDCSRRQRAQDANWRARS